MRILKRKYNRPSLWRKYACFYALVLFGLLSCEKEKSPFFAEADKAGASVNFYCASDVMMIAATGKNSFYIDNYPEARRSPLFVFTSLNSSNEYPVSNSIWNPVYYMSLEAGMHRVAFTDTTRTVLQDTILNMPARTHTTFYFADKPLTANAPAEYNAFSFKEDRLAYQDKVGIRIVHLSPDAGDLTGSIRKVPIAAEMQLLPRINFGQASSYYYTDTTGCKDNIIPLYFSDAAGNDLLNTAIPALPGRNYTLVIQGFKNTVQRRVPLKKNPDGSIVYRAITVPANLRIDTRISY